MFLWKLFLIIIKVLKKAESKFIKNIFYFLKDKDNQKTHTYLFLEYIIRKQAPFFFKIQNGKASTLKVLNSFSEIYHGKPNTLKRFLNFPKCKLRKVAH